MSDARISERLAAILSADAAGYSRLMGEDERNTITTLDACRAVFRQHIEAQNGRVVDMAGDNVLAIFESANRAVQAALAIQKDLAEKNRVFIESRQMNFRIGINLGEVLGKDDGTVYGDGVNIAARLQSLSEPGGICVSGSVHDQIEGKLPLTFKFMGEQTVKNIAKPVRVYRVTDFQPAAPRQLSRFSLLKHVDSVRARILVFVALAVVIAVGSIAWRFSFHDSQREDPALAMPKGPSIAVLPFANLSGDPEQDYFSDGLTEQLISELARFRGLYVIARNSVFKYKGHSPDVREVGRDLGARYILEGSVRRSGETLRVTAQLLEAASGAHLWAETYDRTLTGANIFALQDDITSKTVANIAGPHGLISQAGLEQTTRKAPKNIDSYDCVLRAYVWNRVLSREGHGPLRDCLEAAVARDPDYGEAWAWLAFSYLFEYEAGYNPRPDRYNALDQALKAGQRAVELDPNNAGVHANMSYVRFLRHEYDASLASAERALALNPNDPAVLCQAGQKMVYTGLQVERGLALTKKAMALGPHYPSWCHYHVSYYHYSRGEYEQALAESLKLDLPQVFWTQAFLAMDYGQLGRMEEAKTAITKLLELYPDIALKFPSEARKYNMSVERAMDGLRKAGLKIPEKKS
jgi:adenylate cyclase